MTNEEAFQKVIEQTMYFIDYTIKTTPPFRTSPNRQTLKEIRGYIESFLGTKGYVYKNNSVMKGEYKDVR